MRNISASRHWMIEIAILLLIKVIALGLLWWFCFSHPDRVQHQPATLGLHLFSANGTAPSSSLPSSFSVTDSFTEIQRRRL